MRIRRFVSSVAAALMVAGGVSLAAPPTASAAQAMSIDCQTSDVTQLAALADGEVLTVNLSHCYGIHEGDIAPFTVNFNCNGVPGSETLGGSTFDLRCNDTNGIGLTSVVFTMTTPATAGTLFTVRDQGLGGREVVVRTPLPCGPGTWSATGSEPCVVASPGTFVATTGAVSATMCAAGTYQPDSGADSCLLADVGYYVPVDGSIEQTACPAGTTTLTAGQSTCVALIDALSDAISEYFGGDTRGANGLIAKAAAIAGAPNAKAKSGALKAFTNQVNAKIGKPLTQEQATTLVNLAAQL